MKRSRKAPRKLPPIFRCIFELTLPAPVPNDPKTQNAFQYAVGIYWSDHGVSMHSLSVRDGMDLCFSAPNVSHAEAFVRHIAKDLEGYLAERFAWDSQHVRARVMLKQLGSAPSVLEAMSCITFRDRVGTARMPPDMLCGAGGFVEVRHQGVRGGSGTQSAA